MANNFFRFKHFNINQDKCAMKVTTDACLFGAWCAEEIKIQNSKNKIVLDIGTGTGLLSLMIAQQNQIIIDAIEIDQDAATQATENCSLSKFKDSINIIHSDVLLHERTDYDYIISNPPFYENELKSSLEIKNIAHHSSNLKWEYLFAILQSKINDNGIFFLLLPMKRIKDIEILLNKNQLFIIKQVFVRQTFNHQPFRLMLMGSKKRSEQLNEYEIAIMNDQNQYTPEFTRLLKDYYLYL